MIALSRSGPSVDSSKSPSCTVEHALQALVEVVAVLVQQSQAALLPRPLPMVLLLLQVNHVLNGQMPFDLNRGRCFIWLQNVFGEILTYHSCSLFKFTFCHPLLSSCHNLPISLAHQEYKGTISALLWSAGSKDERCSEKGEYKGTISTLPWSAEGQICITGGNG
jgi:hypothetical protein